MHVIPSSMWVRLGLNEDALLWHMPGACRGPPDRVQLSSSRLSCKRLMLHQHALPYRYPGTGLLSSHLVAGHLAVLS